MKLALDPQMFFATSTVWELPDIVASLGYEHMELSPKADFIPFFKHPRVDDAGVQKLKKVAADAGVGIASVLPVLRWSGPDEDQRQAAVRAWKRTIQIAVDLGVEVINTEFNGRPEAPETAEAQFLKSMDELLPIFEREGLQLILEPHPDDFIEDGLEAVEMIRGLNQDWIGFLYCTPHAFHQGHDAADIIAAAAEKTRYVHLADAWDHTTSNGLRYITNPPGNRSGCTSTWRWAGARSTTTPSSPRWPPSTSTASSPAASSAGRRTPAASPSASATRPCPGRQALRRPTPEPPSLDRQLDQRVGEGNDHGNDAAPLEERRHLRGHGRPVLRRDQPGDR